MKTSEQDARDILANWNISVLNYAQRIEGEPDYRLHTAAQFIGRKILIGGVKGEDEPSGALCVVVNNVEPVGNQISFTGEAQSEPPVPFSFLAGASPFDVRILHVIADAR